MVDHRRHYCLPIGPGAAGRQRRLDRRRPHAGAGRRWAGSAAGQDAFNVQKGSIPARSDADKAIYPVYLQDAMDDWSSNLVAGSLTHGVTASNAWKADIDTALGLFLGDKDVANFQAALVTAAG